MADLTGVELDYRQDQEPGVNKGTGVEGPRGRASMRWKANPDVVAQRLGESMVLVNLATDRILELNETAAGLYEMAKAGLSQVEIERQLAEEYSVQPESLRAELDALLQSLTEEQVVSVDDG